MARTRAAVADAVRTLFAEEGWDAVTHQRIAERSGLGRNTVYRHFPDRTALLLHAGHFNQVHHAPRTGDLRTDLIAELTTFRHELFDGIVGNVMAAMVERADHDPEIGPMRDALVEAGARQTIDIVEEAVAAGRMTDAVSVRDLVAALCGPAVYARLCTGDPPSDAAIEHLVDTHLAPLAPGRPGD
ncbi:MAG: TetR/AcrR family transcriptional regulator [Actinomycetota bacterium]